ncbi:MAG TPA: response regulator [Urbifossiella sp.]|nr:response regulator [Urbifossiella sp.]
MTDRPPTPVATPPAPAPGRVLVVDDDDGVRRFVVHALSRAGHRVDAADSTEAALPLVREQDYDVIIVDLTLPGRSGLDLIAELPAGGCPVPVLLTGCQSVESAVAAMRGGAFDFLQKPTGAEHLLWAAGRAVVEARTRRQARAAARAMAEWEATFDACPDVLLVLDADRRVLKANAAAARLAGAAPDALHGRPVRDIYPDRLGEIAAGPPDGASHRAVAAGRQFLVSTSPLAGRPGPVVVVGRDVTTLVQEKQARVQLARQLLSAHEDERAHMSRELHDGIGQAAVSLSLGLSELIDLVPAGAARDRARDLGRVAADAAHEVRRLAHHLRPPVLDDHGLPAALARLADTFTRTHGVRTQLVTTAAETTRLDPAAEVALYRIVQEALANVAKHASARTTDVLLDVTDGVAHVSVTDDGAGFIPTDDPADGIGLSGMRERAVMLGGSFRVASVPGRGTTVDARIPVGEVAV